VAEAARDTARIEDMGVFFWNQRIVHGELRASAGAAMLRREIRAALIQVKRAGCAQTLDVLDRNNTDL
jgi:hypothetical protein